MDKKKELLKYPIKNKYTLLGMEFLRLHNHGQSLIIRTKFSDSFKKHNYDFLIVGAGLIGAIAALALIQKK